MGLCKLDSNPSNGPMGPGWYSLVKLVGTFKQALYSMKSKPHGLVWIFFFGGEPMMAVACGFVVVVDLGDGGGSVGLW